jgi:MFS family permease
MSIHQTSVYLGTAGGAVLAGYLAERYGWRSPFWALGLAGMAYAALLGFCLIEPVREPAKSSGNKPDHEGEEWESAPTGPDLLLDKVTRIVTNPAAALLLAVFVGANFVAATFLAWLPLYIFESFKLGLADSSMISTSWSLASLAGALCGGVAADWAARHAAGGGSRQAPGLVLDAVRLLAGRSRVSGC